MLSYLHSSRLQSFGNDGLPLVSGAIYSYRLGSTTPKSLFKDINGEESHPNPIILDSAGVAEIYTNGSYTLVTHDMYGNQISVIDIAGNLNDYITSGGSGTFGENLVISVNTYADVRALTNDYSWVFVQGREVQADGGEGLFYLDISDTSTDDDGITLQPGFSGRYIRYNIQQIDPRWFGLVYDDSSDQSVYLTQSEVASTRYARPILINGSVYINSNFSTTSSEYIFTDNAEVISTLSVTYTFTSGTHILECGRRVFGNSVQPIFQKGVWTNDTINYSIFDADNVEGRIAKLEDCSTENYFVRFDESISTSVAPQLPGNFDVQYSGQVVTITSNSPLSFKTSYNGISQIFGYNLLASVGSVSITADIIRPENFGSDNNIAFKVLSTVGRGNLQAGATYEIIENVINGSDISLTCDSNISAANIRLSAATSGTEFINCDRLYLENVLLRLDNTIANIDTLVGKECILSASQDNAILCVIADLSDSYLYREAILSAPSSAVYFTNVQLYDYPTKRFYKNDTTFDSVYLRTLSKTPEYTTLLGIDSDDKVITIDNLELPSISATNVIFENTPVTRKLNPTYIDFRWSYYAPGPAPQCDVYRNNIFVNNQINPLTATYTITSADGPIIIASTSGSTYAQQSNRINLTSAVAENMITQELSVLQDGSLTIFQVAGDVTAMGTYPGLVDQFQYGTRAYYDTRANKWILT